MADDLDNLFFDLTGAAQGNSTPATVAAADPAPVADNTETPATPIDDTEYETIEQVQDKLREEWGTDFESKYQDASNALQQFFKGDTETLEWLSQRIGNHPVAVKIALRLAAIYSGNGLPEKSSPAATPTKELDAQLADFQPGGKLYDQWLGGDSKLNALRIELYRKRHTGEVEIG